jgi:hypothetical protein
MRGQLGLYGPAFPAEAEAALFVLMLRPVRPHAALFREMRRRAVTDLAMTYPATMWAAALAAASACCTAESVCEPHNQRS